MSSPRVLDDAESIDFFGNKIFFTQKTLTPRLETESLVRGVLPILPKVTTVIDVGTGSWCILCALATRFPAHTYIGTDISPEALKVAEHNIVSLGILAQLYCTHLIDGVLSQVPRGSSVLIIANLPYIPDLIVLPDDVISDDPSISLWWGRDGLELILALIKQLRGFQTQFSFFVALELFEGHCDTLESQFSDSVHLFRRWSDPCGVDRFCSFYLPYETA